MSEELKPCPFCGGDAKIKCGEIVNRYNKAVYRHYHVECMSCGVDTRYFDTEAEAIEAWNRRVATDKNVGDKERKKGKWVDGLPYVNSHWWVCSICHVSAPENHTGYNFCPNCGARMTRGE